MMQQQQEPTLKRSHNYESYNEYYEQDNPNRKKQKSSTSSSEQELPTTTATSSSSGLHIDNWSQYRITKAENALKRAADYIQSEQLHLAFLELGAIVSKFGRQIKTWHKNYEDVTKRFITVSVELRMAQEITKVLSSFRAICQSNLEIKSFGNVIWLYLDQVEKHTQKAIEKSKCKSWTLTDNILLYEGLTEREIVSQWMRFLLETYRLVLELLKKEPQLESIYHETYKRTFDFCLN